MKNIKVLIAVLAFTFTSGAFANGNNNEPVPANEISTEISKLLANPNVFVKNEIQAEVTFKLNENNEIVLVSVNTEERSIRNFIEKRLEETKLNVEGTISSDKLYKLVVTVQSENA